MLFRYVLEELGPIAPLGYVLGEWGCMIPHCGILGVLECIISLVCVLIFEEFNKEEELLEVDKQEDEYLSSSSMVYICLWLWYVK